MYLLSDLGKKQNSNKEFFVIFKRLELRGENSPRFILYYQNSGELGFVEFIRKISKPIVFLTDRQRLFRLRRNDGCNNAHSKNSRQSYNKLQAKILPLSLL